MASESTGPQLPRPPQARANGHPRLSNASSGTYVSTASNSDTSSTQRGYEIPTEEQVLQHYRLLAAFEKLRLAISNTPGLFGLGSPPGIGQHDINRIAEKRWQVYVTRAVERFTVWWQKVLPRTFGGMPMDELSKDNLMERLAMWRSSPNDKPKTKAARVDFGVQGLPPLDVIMIWHTYMLNALVFLEDCHQTGRLDLWLSGLPLDAICNSIDQNFDFTMDPVAEVAWTKSSRLPVDNLDMPDRKDVTCPTCGTVTATPWTVVQKITEPAAPSTPAMKSNGWADHGFELRCTNDGCQDILTYESLSSGRFISALRRAEATGVMLPVSLFARMGKLEPDISQYHAKSPNHWPHELFSKLLPKFDKAMATQPLVGMEDIWKFTVLNARETAISKPNPDRQFFLEQMMTHFHLNPSPFGIDLVSAVTRQGIFNRQVVAFDWSTTNTTNPDRLKFAFRKYQRFFTLWKKYAFLARNPLVPTLDMDLVWSTHLLRPEGYFKHTMATTKRFVNHGERRCEWEHNTAFIRTCQVYWSNFRELYDCCGCWYCEGVRATHLPTFSTFIIRKETLRTLLPEPGDPATHISACNAVFADIADTAAAASLRDRFEQLLYHHRRATEVRAKYGAPKFVADAGYPTTISQATGSSVDSLCPENFAVDPTVRMMWSTLEIRKSGKGGSGKGSSSNGRWGDAVSDSRDSAYWAGGDMGSGSSGDGGSSGGSSSGGCGGGGGGGGGGGD
ncbi:hypothetical protein BZA05DRAFT_352302 [Tricharina praecox]|uniref:uncharacterized protein n=1 Tax=Tricharina praecox TaxID=43433 RepID=UPI0022207B05|nr:uncharacterized protein BZA05DRAFT_352302 [Tricharina praecox]KAI5853316.1 hypothetical protein BZA05DRAFT_352302 [Tricharina praecox]